jgi:Tfp pilus assembly protein PilF
MSVFREKLRRNLVRVAAWGVFLATAIGLTYYTNTVRAKALQAEDLLDAGERALDAGNTPKAERVLESALRSNPKLLAAHDLLAVAYDSQGEPEKAYEQRRAAVKADPFNPQAHYLLAIAYVADKRYVEAIEELNRVVALDPTNRNAEHLLAHCYIWNGQPEKAEDIFRAMLADDPDDVVAQRGLTTAGEQAGAAADQQPVGDAAGRIRSPLPRR